MPSFSCIFKGIELNKPTIHFEEVDEDSLVPSYKRTYSLTTESPFVNHSAGFFVISSP